MAGVHLTADERRVRRSDPNLNRLIDKKKEARDLTSLFSGFRMRCYCNSIKLIGATALPVRCRIRLVSVENHQLR